MKLIILKRSVKKLEKNESESKPTIRQNNNDNRKQPSEKK